ncbi:hypothetical protein J27TS8_25660 [Robertmurraya siralis]|uniref:Uncharacterized protein n=1 Tax=Robertmurraya siralis TaxID=77777 RepID=A0A919WIT4_9BACI|nr:hypothetical protein J27TS8_25660 [Robertmurraya siralis]
MSVPHYVEVCENRGTDPINRIEAYMDCKEIIEQYNFEHHPHITEAVFKLNRKFPQSMVI